MERLQCILNRPEHGAFVAEQEGSVVGWIHVYVAHIIEAPNSYVEIGGLVVDESQRGTGIGRALIEAAEDWTRRSGFDDIRLRSASKRVEAHKFYESLGYRIVKTQMRFEKKLIHSE
jgi:GNAT superfamily N-acetyltransferase